MIANTPQIAPISAEELRAVYFKNTPGFLTDSELKERQSKLHMSVLLQHHAGMIVKIIFNTLDGYKEIKASVWGATEKYIILSSGNFIPTESVAQISSD